MKTLAITATSVLLAAGLTGCGRYEEPKAAEPTAPPSRLPAAVGTVQGQLRLVGGPAPGVEDPAAGRLTIKGGGSTLHADIGKDGKYAIQLVPGSYRITATSPSYNNGRGLCVTEPVQTKLAAGATVTADVLCNMR